MVNHATYAFQAGQARNATGTRSISTSAAAFKTKARSTSAFSPSPAEAHGDGLHLDDLFGGSPGAIAFESLSDTLERTSPQRDDVVPGLIPSAETTAFVCSPDTETSMFAMALGYSIAGWKPFPPFGLSAGVRVAYCSASGDKDEDGKRLAMIRDRDPNSKSRERACGQLYRFYRDDLGIDQRHFSLVVVSNQRHLQQALPPDCKLVIFDGLDEWATSGGQVHYGDLADFLADLNRASIAVAIFIPGSGRDSTADIAALGIRKRNVIHLARDSTSLSEFGATINITRPKRGEDDPIPRCVQFSYTVVGGKFDFTWACREPLSIESAKQLKIAERRKKVEELLPTMPQKDIAAFLGVTPSTISRDAGEIDKANAKKSPPAQTGSDYD
ncbi:MAG: AAA family ATPase [Rhodocyclales bacterium]|nr:AAA family ATPase [Rhodocyclales bacterium]